MLSVADFPYTANWRTITAVHRFMSIESSDKFNETYCYSRPQQTDELVLPLNEMHPRVFPSVQVVFGDVQKQKPRGRQGVNHFGIDATRKNRRITQQVEPRRLCVPAKYEPFYIVKIRRLRYQITMRQYETDPVVQVVPSSVDYSFVAVDIVTLASP